MNENKVQNQTPVPQNNMGMNPMNQMNNWNWQHVNPYAQQRPFYWNGWGNAMGPQFNHMMGFRPPNPGGGLLPHPQMPFGGVNFGFLTQGQNQKPMPPLPQSEKPQESSKPVENPDKIPLPDGPPPPLPAAHQAGATSNLQKTGFTPFTLGGGKKKRKNKNRNGLNAFAHIFNKNNPNFMNTPKMLNTVPAPPLPSAPPPVAPPPPSESPEVTPTVPKHPGGQSSVLSSPQNVTRVPAGPLLSQVPNDWPKSLLEYVNRCYSTCKTDMDKDQVSIVLKGKITEAMSSNTLYTRRWEVEALPMVRGHKFSQPAQNTTQPVGFRGRNRLSESVKSRLGGKPRNYRQTRRSLSKSPVRERSYRSRSRSSRSHSSSRSPRRRNKRSSDSSSSDENYKSLTVKKKKEERRKAFKKNRKGKNKKQGQFFSNTPIGEMVAASSERLQLRAERFKGTLDEGESGGSGGVTPRRPPILASAITWQEDSEGDYEFNDLHIVGTCQDLEKPFLRLTSAPDASQVRPVDVLQKSLSLVKEKWLEKAEYRYTCEQLKSIRQDLTVQGVRDEFTVEVYETHARICLEKGDHEEFNQCQTQLKMLYLDIGGEHELEFTAYRILYYIYTKNTLDLTTIIGSLSSEQKQDACISHALQLAGGWLLNNYHRLFSLYRHSPKMSSYLVDWFIERERKAALKTMIKAYRQTLPVVFVAESLSFESVDKFFEFSAPFALTYCDEERTKLDCKASMAQINAF